ncbi:helix-turn-helix domain-containing protein [Oscillospiraceae bacterium 38-13]
MNFKELLSRAKDDDLQAKEVLLERYKSLLLKEAIIDNVFDEDLYQELCVTLLDCIRKFRI